MKRVCFLIILFFLAFPCSTILAQTNQTYSDTFTITTYYPAPHGVYGTMRLYPGNEPTEGADPGAMYYDQAQNVIKFHNATAWVNLSGGGGEGYWTQSGNDIRNTNIGGNVNVSDVCTNGGLCLNSTLTTRVGLNPVCPLGQMVFMKASGGVWYAGDNSSLASWDKVVCSGKPVSGDGSSFLANGLHTMNQCSARFTDSSGNIFCRMTAVDNSATCPSGWYSFNRWTYTTSAECGYRERGAGAWCATGSHSWNNTAVETCDFYSGPPGFATKVTCTANVIEIGCY